MRTPRPAEVVLALTSFCFALLSAEIGLRVLQRMSDGTPVLSLLPGYRDATFQRSPFLVFGPRVDWSFEREGDPSWTRFNELGIRLPGPVPAREPGEVRVLALGGSTTEDVWNELGIHWPLGLECLLREGGRADVRVLNAGMSAYTTAHSLVRYQLDLVETRPDVVLVMHNINDLTVSYYAAAKGTEVDPSYLVKYGDPVYTSKVGEDDVVLSRLASAAKARLFPDPVGLLPFEEWEDDPEPGVRYFERNLRALVSSVRASGAVPVLLTMPRTTDPAVVDATRLLANSPGISLLPGVERFFRDFDRFNDVIREVGAGEGATVVDMAALVADGPGIFADAVHFETEGSRAFARILAGTAGGWLPPTTGIVLRDRGGVVCDGVF